jgi:hypothetical protein
MTRKNPAVPVTREPVTLEFKGKSYEISFGFNDFVEIENMAGTSFLGGVTSLGRPPLALVRAMLFFALNRAGAEYESPEQVGALLQLKEIAPIWRTLLEAVYQSRAGQDPPQAAAEN